MQQGLEKEMFNKNFCAECDENEASEGFDFAFEKVTEFFSDEDADVREQKCYQANDKHSGGEWNDQKREGYSDGEGVYTGGDGKGEQNDSIWRVEILSLGFDFERFINHPAADGS